MSTESAAATAEPTSVAEVVDRLQTIQGQAAASDQLGERDGLACFNFLYTSITKDVLAKIQQSGWFDDDTFLATLDLEFAKRYLSALDAYQQAPDSAPRSWQVLLDRRADGQIAPIQFAAAGVNAHVNFDLALALVATCESLGRELGEGTQRRDYQRVNEIFASQMADLRHHFEDQLDRELDESILKSLNDAVDDSLVVLTRDAAWHHATHLWTIRADAHAMEEQTDAMDLLVSLAGRGILFRH